MESKQLIDMFPFGYTCLNNQNGSITLSLDTKSTDGYVVAKKVPLNDRMPPITQKDIDLVQLDWRNTGTIVDWFNDDACRYFIAVNPQDALADYNLILHAFFGDETFEIRGYFTEKEGENHRKRVCNERFLKQVSPDAVTTEMDFTNERYDIIFPDDALSHCRRLGEIIAMNAICPPNVHASLPGEATSHDNESMENNDEPDFE